ncbi:hypothetical protein F4861DRAFT_544678 [Xylaria intraflava]|nr:hypothetical protein F4861DRAFT_544678 [Xylaria intraflava]
MDLDRALRSTHPGWTTAFRNKHSHEIALNTLRHQDIATELRQEATILGASRPNSGKVVRGGAFSTFGTSSDQEEPEEPDEHTDEERPRGGRSGRGRGARGRSESRPRGRGNSRKSSRNPSSKRPRADTRTESEKESPNVADCIVCFGRHAIDRCWFVFPELRRPEWNINKQIERLALLRMDTEEEVKRAVKTARERRKEKRVRFNTSGEDPEH